MKIYNVWFYIKSDIEVRTTRCVIDDGISYSDYKENFIKMLAISYGVETYDVRIDSFEICD